MTNATTRELLRLVAREYARETMRTFAPWVTAGAAFGAMHVYVNRRR